MNEAQWRWLRQALGVEIAASAQDRAPDVAQDQVDLDIKPLPRASDGGLRLPNGRVIQPSVSARVVHSEPGYVNSEGDWLAATGPGIVPQGPVLATDFVLGGLPPLLQWKFGPIRYGHDSAAQGFLIVPTDAKGATLTLSPPRGYSMPTLDALQEGAYWQGMVTGATQDLPQAAREVLRTAEDLQALSRGGLLLDGPQSLIGQQIQDGSFSLDRTMGSVVVNSPLGWLTDVAAGTSNSLRRAGATGVVNAASALAPAGVAAVFGRMARLDVRITDASLLGEVRGGPLSRNRSGPEERSLDNIVDARALALRDSLNRVASWRLKASKSPVLMGASRGHIRLPSTDRM